MKHIARTGTTPQGVSSNPTPRLISRFEVLLKGGLLFVALVLLAGFMPCGAATPESSATEWKTPFDADATPVAGTVHQHQDADRDDAPLLILALAGFALLAVSRVPSNPKKAQPQGDFRSGKNDARGQDLPVPDVDGTQLAVR